MEVSEAAAYFMDKNQRARGFGSELVPWSTVSILPWTSRGVPDRPQVPGGSGPAEVTGPATSYAS